MDYLIYNLDRRGRLLLKKNHNIKVRNDYTKVRND